MVLLKMFNLREKRQWRISSTKRKNHGPQEIHEYSYCFKTFIQVDSNTISLTCFSPQANTRTTDSSELLSTLENKDLYQLPYSLKELKGRKHIFKFHFDTTKISRIPDFILDTVLDHTRWHCQHQILNQCPQQTLQSFHQSRMHPGASHEQKSMTVKAQKRLNMKIRFHQQQLIFCKQ